MSAAMKKARIAMGLSRQDVSSMAKRAGHVLSSQTVAKIEDTGVESVGRGGAGLAEGTSAWLSYILGLAEGQVDWSTVEVGSPVLVADEKKGSQFSFRSAGEDGSINVFGGVRNQEKFRSFEGARVRLVAPTVIPPEAAAAVFETRARGTNNGWVEKVKSHIESTPGAHSIGTLAYTLGMDNGVVSRTMSQLETAGTVKKISRGTYVLASEAAAAPEAPSASPAEAPPAPEAAPPAPAPEAPAPPAF